ncbi:MAG: T9SS type A sorting domain-containing protein [Calditrichaeota bacterium]|nr:T9SS type A sorting domain-containing protein [Calditrichota bacterium]
MKENVVLQGAGADKCIIDGGNIYYGWPDNFVIYCDSITNGKIDGFTIKYSKGGGIGCLESFPIITNNKIINCLSRGILCLFRYPLIQHPTINGNTITGNGLGLYYMLDGLEYLTVDTLDASNNWWGTTVESEIQTGIRELEGPYMYYYVHYSPWLTEPIDSLPQLEEGLHWNNIYDNKELNLCIADVRLSIDEKRQISVPGQIYLYQNYPNPFNLATVIHYQLSNKTSIHTTLKIYNLIGKEVRTLVNNIQSAGEYQAVWDGKDKYGNMVTSGIYFYKLISGSLSRTKKLILTK